LMSITLTISPYGARSSLSWDWRVERGRHARCNVFAEISGSSRSSISLENMSKRYLWRTILLNWTFRVYSVNLEQLDLLLGSVKVPL